MVFTETIALEDEVTPAARTAQMSLVSMVGGLQAVQSSLAKGIEDPGFAEAATSADAYAEALGRVQDASGAGMGSVTASMPESAPMGDVGAGIDMGDAMPSGDGLEAARDSAAELSAELGLLGGVVDELGTKTIGEHLVDVPTDGLVDAQAALIQTAHDTDKLGEHLDGVAKPAEAASGGLSTMFADAAHAAETGAATIGAAMDGIKGAFASLGEGDVQGAIGGVTDAIAGMAQMLDMVVPGLGQLVSTVIKIAGGIVGITAGLIQSGMAYAISASQSKQASLASWDALGQGVATGAEVDDMLSGLADKIGISKDELAPLTTEFMKMGVTGTEALERLTLAAMSAEAITAGGAAGFTNLQKKIQLAAETSGTLKIDNKILKTLGSAGVNVDDLAKGLRVTSDQLKDMQVDATKLGDVMTEAIIAKGEKSLAHLGTTLGSIRKKFDQDLGDMFEDIDVGPFMKEVKELFGIVGASSESGKALKAGIGAFFTEAFAIAARLVPVVKNLFLDMIIFGLKAYIALHPITKVFTRIGEETKGFGTVLAQAAAFVMPYIKKLAGFFVEFFQQIANSKPIVDGLMMVLKTIGVVIGIVIAAVVAVIVVIGVFMAMCVSMGAIVMGLIGQIISFATNLTMTLGAALAGAVATLTGWVSSAWQVGADFVAGLIKGITDGAAMIGDAVKGVADSAIGTFKSVLGINSPSTVMAGFGVNMGEGLVQGTEQVAPDVYGAGADMASMTVAGATGASSSSVSSTTAPAAAPTASSDSGSGSKSITIETGAIVIQGAGKDMMEITEEMVAAIMERIAMQAGVA